MHIDNTSNSTRMQEGLEQITGLRADANESHIAEHIRGMVAATMGHLSVHASQAARLDAEQWQHWAMGIANGLGDGLGESAMPIAGSVA